MYSCIRCVRSSFSESGKLSLIKMGLGLTCGWLALLEADVPESIQVLDLEIDV